MRMKRASVSERALLEGLTPRNRPRQAETGPPTTAYVGEKNGAARWPGGPIESTKTLHGVGRIWSCSLLGCLIGPGTKRRAETGGFGRR